MGSKLVVSKHGDNSSDDSKSLTEYDWALDYINEFVDSPLWRNPVQSYIDENCFFFQGKDEIQHSQYDIHKGFTELIEKIIVKYVHSIGLTTGQFVTAISSGGKQRLSQKIIKFIMCFDDLNVFREMMYSRNVELEGKARRLGMVDLRASRR